MTSRTAPIQPKIQSAWCALATLAGISMGFLLTMQAQWVPLTGSASLLEALRHTLATQQFPPSLFSLWLALSLGVFGLGMTASLQLAPFPLDEESFQTNADAEQASSALARALRKQGWAAFGLMFGCAGLGWAAPVLPDDAPAMLHLTQTFGAWLLFLGTACGCVGVFQCIVHLLALRFPAPTSQGPLA